MKRWPFFFKKNVRALLSSGALALSSLVAPAQTVADSLARILATTPPNSTRVLLLTDLAWEINETQTDTAERHLNEAVALAQRLKFPRGEALAWNGLGVVAEVRGNMAHAEKNYRRALVLRQQLGDKQAVANSYNNLGVLYEQTGQPDSAIASHKRNLAIQQELRDTVRIARALFNIASVLQETGDYTDAREKLYEARAVLEAANDRDGMAKVYTQLGHIYLELDRYTDALLWYERALNIRRELNTPARLAEALSDYANALDETSAANANAEEAALGYYQQALEIWDKLVDLPGKAKVYTNLGDVHKRIGNYERALQYLREAEAICMELDDQIALMEVYNTQGDVFSRMGRQAQSLELVKKYFRIATETDDKKYIQSAYKDFAEVYAKMGNHALAYDYRVRYDEYRYDRLREKERSDFARQEILFESEQREKELIEKEAAYLLQESELARSRNELYASLAGVLALLALAALLFSRNRLRARANRDLAAKNKAIEQERRRADELLANILPAETAAELKAYARVKPVRYAAVTVMFTDFKNFTAIAESLPSEVLIAELDECFSLFDSIVQEFGLEKIKTIGDAYMCAGGLPTPNDTHPVDTVRAAITMQQRLQLLMEQKKAQGKPVFEMRIGIHTGPVVAGVVGRHKFAYDIWGDTVNTAARLEQGGEPNKVNISETTYLAVKDTFTCTYRGRLSAKNKGEVAMYFVEI
ncbi:MAG: adenylate/guanylate cyclase domain-containing protein [Saprospiraceae bacterium]